MNAFRIDIGTLDQLFFAGMLCNMTIDVLSMSDKVKLEWLFVNVRTQKS